ncbi:MAG: leucine zipper domain-containing protein, partial [Myxococcota bacterium]
MRPPPKAKGNPYQRRLFVRRIQDQGWSVAEASEAAGWSERTGFKWLRRWREESEEGLRDRRSGPRRVRNRTPRGRVEKILKLRRKRQTSRGISERIGKRSGLLRPGMRSYNRSPRDEWTTDAPSSRWATSGCTRGLSSPTWGSGTTSSASWT